jgi:hypothetical protein
MFKVEEEANQETNMKQAVRFKAEDRTTLHNHRCEKLNSDILYYFYQYLFVSLCYYLLSLFLSGTQKFLRMSLEPNSGPGIVIS